MFTFYLCSGRRWSRVYRAVEPEQNHDSSWQWSPGRGQAGGDQSGGERLRLKQMRLENRLTQNSRIWGTKRSRESLTGKRKAQQIIIKTLTRGFTRTYKAWLYITLTNRMIWQRPGRGAGLYRLRGGVDEQMHLSCAGRLRSAAGGHSHRERDR